LMYSFSCSSSSSRLDCCRWSPPPETRNDNKDKARKHKDRQNTKNDHDIRTRRTYEYVNLLRDLNVMMLEPPSLLRNNNLSFILSLETNIKGNFQKAFHSNLQLKDKSLCYRSTAIILLQYPHYISL
jgi:hypothetical protein